MIKDIEESTFDFIWIILWLGLTVLCIFLPSLNTSIIRMIFAVPSILFLLGYTLIAALFPRQKDLDAIKRIVLSFGLSIAIVLLMGLLLNYTHWGIRLESVMLSLILITIFLAVLAEVRRQSLPPQERFTVPLKNIATIVRHTLLLRWESRSKRVLSFVLLLSILLAVGATIYMIAMPKERKNSTEFYPLEITMPTTIRVLRTATGTVDVVNFKEYVENVLPNEWWLSWDYESLKTGAMAVKNHGIYRTLHPQSPNYDVTDSSSTDQVYIPSTAQQLTNQAIEETWDWVILKNGSIFGCPYNLGTEGTPEMIYEGSDINEGYSLQGYLSQWGSQYWAENGKDWQWILHYYYDPIDIVKISQIPPTFNTIGSS